MDLARGEGQAVSAGEHQGVRVGVGVGGQVLADVLGQVGRQVEGVASGGGLRGGDDALATDGDGGLLHGDGAFGEVEVPASQCGQFAEPEPAPGGQEHQQLVARRHRVGDGLHLCDGEQGHVLGVSTCGRAFDVDG